MRQVIIYPGEDGYWVAECPSLPGCLSQGKTRAEAMTNIREAIRGYVAALEPVIARSGAVARACPEPGEGNEAKQSLYMAEIASLRSQ